MAFITINGREFPAPDNVWELVVATNVTEGKNAQGEFRLDETSTRSITCNGPIWMRKPGRRCAKNLIPLL